MTNKDIDMIQENIRRDSLKKSIGGFIKKFGISTRNIQRYRQMMRTGKR